MNLNFQISKDGKAKACLIGELISSNVELNSLTTTHLSKASGISKWQQITSRPLTSVPLYQFTAAGQLQEQVSAQMRHIRHLDPDVDTGMDMDRIAQPDPFWAGAIYQHMQAAKRRVTGVLYLSSQLPVILPVLS